MTTVWDSHIHLFTEEMSTTPENWADVRKEPIWKACVAPPGRPSIQGWSTVDQLLKDMDHAEVERVILLGWYWENQEPCQLHNRFYAELIQQHPHRLSAFAAIQPAKGELALSEISWARDAGFRGLGEIHPQAQGFSLTDKCWQTVLEHISGWDFPVNLHVTDPVSRHLPGKVETPLGDYVEMAGQWPNQIFILAHLGGLIPLHAQTETLRKRLKNVYYDCAAIPLLYESSVLNQVAAMVGADKILFGSDYPLKSFPRKQTRPGFKLSIQFVEESGLTEKQLDLVLSSNAKRLFTI